VAGRLFLLALGFDWVLLFYWRWAFEWVLFFIGAGLLLVLGV